MKCAVHALREQLTRKTRRPAVNTVLTAAYEEIQVCLNLFQGLLCVASNLSVKKNPKILIHLPNCTMLFTD